jgi:hypothetical protein
MLKCAPLTLTLHYYRIGNLHSIKLEILQGITTNRPGCTLIALATLPLLLKTALLQGQPYSLFQLVVSVQIE